MENIFEIVKITGLGLPECMDVYHSTGLLYRNKTDAEQEADKLWKEQTTEEDRKSGWCALHYVVKERSVK